MSTSRTAHLSALALLLSLVACGGGGDDPPASESPGPAPTPTTSPTPTATPTPTPTPTPAPAITAADCYDASLGDTPGSNYDVAFRQTPSGGGAVYEYIETGSIDGPVAFNGYEAYIYTQTTIDPGPPAATVAVYRYYAKRTGPAERTQYGLTYGPDANTVTTTLLENPPAVDGTYALSPGQSLSSSFSHTPNLSVTFAGIETVTVPAGSYSACRFVLDSTSPAYSNQRWILVGTGVVVKEVQSQPNQGSVTIEATSVRVNGVAR